MDPLCVSCSSALSSLYIPCIRKFNCVVSSKIAPLVGCEGARPSKPRTLESVCQQLPSLDLYVRGSCLDDCKRGWVNVVMQQEVLTCGSHIQPPEDVHFSIM